MTDESADYREQLSRLPDEALVRITRAKVGEYRPEAIAVAGELLRSRGRDLNDGTFVREALEKSDYDAQARAEAAQIYTDTAPTPAYPGPAWLLMAAGFGVFAFMMRGFNGRSPNSNIYIATFAMLLLAASEYEVLRTWHQRSRLTKIRSFKFLLPAAILASWSLLLVLGVVHY